MNPNLGAEEAFTTSEDFKSGFVALAGRPNAGKSTLLNALLSCHVAPQSPVSQTTRRLLTAILTTREAQLIILDTPGIHKPKDALGKELNAISIQATQDADVVLYTLSASASFGRGDAWVLQQFLKSKALYCVLTKCDVATTKMIAAQKEAIAAYIPLNHVYETSAKTGKGIAALTKALSLALPPGPLWYPPQERVGTSTEEIIASLVEEQVLLFLKDELPHATTCIVTETALRKNGLLYIGAQLLVERESQRAIVVGKHGAMIKKIGAGARKTIEGVLGRPVYLDLRVKVVPKWRKDANVLRELGY